MRTGRNAVVKRTGLLAQRQALIDRQMQGLSQLAQADPANEDGADPPGPRPAWDNDFTEGGGWDRGAPVSLSAAAAASRIRGCNYPDAAAGGGGGGGSTNAVAFGAGGGWHGSGPSMSLQQSVERNNAARRAGGGGGSKPPPPVIVGVQNPHRADTVHEQQPVVVRSQQVWPPRPATPLAFEG